MRDEFDKEVLNAGWLNSIIGAHTLCLHNVLGNIFAGVRHHYSLNFYTVSVVTLKNTEDRNGIVIHFQLLL